MRKILWIAFGVLLYTSGVVYAEIVDVNGDAVDARSKFEEVVSKNPTALVEFYDVNCGFCKKMVDVVEEYAKNNSVIRVNVDHTKIGENKFASDIGVRGTPHFYMLKDGKPYGNPNPGAMPKERFISYVSDPTKAPAPRHPTEPKTIQEIQAHLYQLIVLDGKVRAEIQDFETKLQQLQQPTKAH